MEITLSLAQENAQLKEENTALRCKIAELEKSLEWFRKQIFGQKSERYEGFPEGESDTQEPLLPHAFTGPTKTPDPTHIPAHTRTRCRNGSGPKGTIPDNAGVSGLRFDSTVDVEEIECENSATVGRSPEEYDVIGHEVVDKLCQRKKSFYVKRYKRPKVRLKESGAIITAPAPPSVIPGSFMDVSFLVSMIVEKILFHLPLYRTHQKLRDAGVFIARSTLTNGFHAAGDLLQPVFHALIQHICSSRVLTMDETPVKIGVDTEKRRMHQGYFWGLYGDCDEVAFESFDTRSYDTVKRILGERFSGVLLSDDYGAYARYAKRCEETIQALCWSHTRRKFYDVRDSEPQKADIVLTRIKGIYQVEETIREKKLEGAAKLAYRTTHAAPLVTALFEWMEKEQQDPLLLPQSPYAKALKYTTTNETGLRQFLADPDIPIDTNHMERANKGVAIGKRNWLCVSRRRNYAGTMKEAA